MQCVLGEVVLRRRVEHHLGAGQEGIEGALAQLAGEFHAVKLSDSGLVAPDDASPTLLVVHGRVSGEDELEFGVGLPDAGPDGYEGVVGALGT